MNTKKIFLLILLNVLVFTLYAKQPDQVQDNDVILIRHFYELSNTKKSTIKIYKNNNQVETVEIPAITDEDKNNSYTELQKILQKFTSEGYIIVTSNLASSTIKITTIYVLQKK